MFKLDLAVTEGEQGMVAANAHVFTGVEAGAPLANDDIAREDGFPTRAMGLRHN